MGKKVTVSTQIDNELRIAARTKAAAEDKPLAHVLRDLIKQWLKSDKPTPTQADPPADKE